MQFENRQILMKPNASNQPKPTIEKHSSCRFSNFVKNASRAFNQNGINKSLNGRILLQIQVTIMFCFVFVFVLVFFFCLFWGMLYRFAASHACRGFVLGFLGGVSCIQVTVSCFFFSKLKHIERLYT